MQNKPNRETLNGTLRSFLTSCRIKSALKLLPAPASWIYCCLSFNLPANLVTGISCKCGVQVFNFPSLANPITIPLDNTLVSVHQYQVVGIFPVH